MIEVTEVRRYAQQQTPNVIKSVYVIVEVLPKPQDFSSSFLLFEGVVSNPFLIIFGCAFTLSI